MQQAMALHCPVYAAPAGPDAELGQSQLHTLDTLVVVLRSLRQDLLHLCPKKVVQSPADISSAPAIIPGFTDTQFPAEMLDRIPIPPGLYVRIPCSDAYFFGLFAKKPRASRRISTVRFSSAFSFSSSRSRAVLLSG